MSRTIMIMAGGTGGHIFPALAVAEFLREHGWKIVWLGSRSGMEATLVPPKGYTMVWIRFSGLRGKGILRVFMLPINLLIAFWQSAGAIFRNRPDVVLGMGGYIAFPGGMMASMLNRPLVVHEQNAVAGLTNRVLATFANRVLVAFPDAFAGKTKETWIGNPVRAEIGGMDVPEMRYQARSGRLNLLVLGGSQGALALNTAVPAALQRIPLAERPLVTHQSGTVHFEALRNTYRAAGVEADLVPFIDNMSACYARADVVICRAGASTIAELAAAGVASVLVPLPSAVDDHQTQNARFLLERGAAVLIPQHEFTPECLAQVLAGFTRDALLVMARAARAAAKPDATRGVAEVCMELAHAA
jgi:UDP-N-acetylglucosamine--N-acetylmuramyl-(pentapeptide) pyrophosphoryl-undecaprenol N-acetylglucosamine transferase